MNMYYLSRSNDAAVTGHPGVTVAFAQSDAIAAVPRVKQLQQRRTRTLWGVAGAAAAFVAAVLFGTAAHAASDAPVRASTPKAYDTALQNAFECRSVAPNIDLALQARQILLDGQTHATLNPPITVLGFKVSDVTVFRDGGEDVYTSYIKGQGAALAAALKKAKWPGASGFLASALPGGVTRLACSISTEPASDSDETD